MLPCAPGPASQAANSASIHTPPAAAARPRTASDSPPGGRRFATLISSSSPSVTSVSPTNTPSVASRTSGTGWPSPWYHNDHRRCPSRSNRSPPTPAAGPPGGGTRGERHSPAEAAPVRRTNVRRSMASMLVMLGALSTTVGAQSSGAIGVGFAATLGPSWQIEGGEIGYVRRLTHGPVRALSVGARLGSFTDEGAIIGGNRGFVFAPTLAARSPGIMVAELGGGNHLTRVSVAVTLEATG